MVDRAWRHWAAARFLESYQLGRHLEELQTYLGGRYDWNLFFRHHLAVDEEEEAAADEGEFYRTSEAYLYDLTLFALSRTKAPYLATVQRLLGPGGRVLDYGCGIGSDGLGLLEKGFRVEFADFENPSTRFLRWRLDHRGFRAPIHDLDTGVPGGFDVAYSFDVIEHVDDPFEFVEALEQRARIVVVNLLEPDPEDTHLHRPLPISALLDRAEQRGLLHYRRYYGRSHLVAYRSDRRGSGVARARSWLGRRAGAALSARPSVS
jgi:SAM-dependent methyltransferase